MRALRLRTLGTIFTTLSILAGGAGCSRQDATAGSSSASAEPATPAPIKRRRAELALSYVTSDAEKAIAHAQEKLRGAPDSLPAHLALATALVRRARATSREVYRTYARDVLVAARSIDPGDPQLKVLSTMLLLDEHKFEAAAAAAKALVPLLPHDPTPKLLLGDARLELGDYDDAMDAYQAAVDLRPDLRSYNRGAFLRWMQGDFDGALKVLELALQSGSARDPESMAWCFADLGSMYLHRGDAPRAKAAAERALASLENYVPALVVKARALELEGKTAEAAEILAQAVERRPSAEDFLRLSELHEALGNTDAAAKVMRNATNLVAADPRPMALYLARRGESPEEALRLAEAELQTRRNVWSYDTLALAQLRAGKTQEAKRAIEKAMALNTPDASFSLHAGLIEFELEAMDSAREHLNKALALDPSVDGKLVDELRAKLEEA